MSEEYIKSRELGLSKEMKFTEKGMGRFIRAVPILEERKYLRGDYAAVDILLDLEKALRLANLTNKQQVAIHVVDGLGYALREAAAVLGVDVSTVSRIRKAGLRKIARIYQRWRYLQ